MGQKQLTQQGLLSQFAPEIRETSLNLKREHKRWGAARILLEMQQMASLAKQKLPSRSHLYPYFREHCPECLNIWTRHKEVPRPARATAVHEVWQVDHQEGHRLGNGSIATVCNIRDPYGAAMIASQAFEVKTEKRWRKLTWEEVRQVLRTGFCEWQTLPDSVQTDNEMGLGGNPNDPFPSWLSLYLAAIMLKMTVKIRFNIVETSISHKITYPFLYFSRMPTPNQFQMLMLWLGQQHRIFTFSPPVCFEQPAKQCRIWPEFEMYPEIFPVCAPQQLLCPPAREGTTSELPEDSPQ